MINLPEIIGNNSVGSVTNEETSTDFTGRIQLVYSTSKVRNGWKGKDKKKPDVDTFWFGPADDRGFSLGDNFFAIPIETRNHALKLKDNTAEFEAFQRPKSGSPPANKEQEIFMMIEGMARDRKNPLYKYPNSAIFGSDVLFFVPGINECGIYFFHGTASNEAANARANKGKFVHIKTTQLPSKATGNDYTSVIVEDADPKDIEKYKDHAIDGEKLKSEHTKFINPLPKTGEQQITQTPDGRVR